MNSKDIALKAFYLQDYITGTETGGIEPPRIITEVRCLDGQAVDIEYTYPETCGLSDVRYHHLGYGKKYTASYLIDNGKISILKDGKWDANVFGDVFLDECRKEVERFYRETEMEAASIIPCLQAWGVSMEKKQRKEEHMPYNINREDITIASQEELAENCVYKFTLPQPLFKFLDVFENEDDGQLYGYIHG